MGFERGLEFRVDKEEISVANECSKRLAVTILVLYVLLGAVYFYEMWTGKVLIPGDAFAYYYPLLLYYASNPSIVSWLPYIFLGMVGMLSAGLLYPVHVMYFFLPASVAFNLNIILHCVLAAYFTFLYVRLLNIALFPSFMSGLVFAFSGFLMAHKGHTVIVNAAVWLPLLLFLYEKMRTTLSSKYSAWTAIVIAIQVFAAHYQICVYTYLVLGFFTLFYLSSVAREKRLNFIFLCIVPIVVGSLIALPQIMETKEAGDISMRAAHDYNFSTTYSFSPFMLPQLFFPFLFGEAYGGHYWGSWNLTELASFIGVMPLMLGLWAAVRLWKINIHARFLALLASLAFLLALGRYNPLYHIMYYVPVYNLFRCPARHWLEFDLAMAVLSGFGLNFLIYEPVGLKKRKEIAVLMGVVLIVSVMFILAGMSFVDAFTGTLLPEVRNVFASAFNFKNPAVYVPLLFMGFYFAWACLFAWIGYNSKEVRNNSQTVVSVKEKILLGILALACFAEGFSFGGFHDAHYVKQSDVRKQLESPVMVFLQKNAGHERSVFITKNVIHLYNVPARVQTLNGYSQFMPKGLNEFLYMWPNGVSSNWPGLLRNNLMLSSLNVRYVIVPKQDVAQYKLDEIKATGTEMYMQSVSLGQWDLINSKKTGSDGSEYILASPDGKQVSMIKQRIALKPNTYYLMKLEAKRMRNEPQRELSFDLCGGPGYDSPDQELDVNGRALQRDYRVFGRIINTGNIPPQVDLRVFTFSTEPILVKNIEIQELSNFGPPYIAGDVSNISTEESLYKKVFETPEWVVYENRNCLPRAFTVSKLQPVRDIQEVKFLFETFQINPSETALVSEDDLKKIGRSDFVKGTTIIEQYDTDRIVVRTNVFGGPGFLVLSDQYFPGWKAFVDGKETPIYKVHEIIRGIVIPEGEHKVEFVYRPWKIYISIFIGAVTLVACLVAVLKLK